MYAFVGPVARAADAERRGPAGAGAVGVRGAARGARHGLVSTHRPTEPREQTRARARAARHTLHAPPEALPHRQPVLRLHSRRMSIVYDVLYEYNGTVLRLNAAAT